MPEQRGLDYSGEPEIASNTSHILVEDTKNLKPRILRNKIVASVASQS